MRIIHLHFINGTRNIIYNTIPFPVLIPLYIVYSILVIFFIILLFILFIFF